MGRIGLTAGTYPLNSLEETLNFGKQVARALPENTILALTGELGSGKTSFVQGLALGLGIDEPIQSPTFVLLNVYVGLVHFDLYRIEGAKEFIDLGFMEHFHNNAICAIEWSERIETLLPKDTVYIHFSYESHGRTAEVKL